MERGIQEQQCAFWRERWGFDGEERVRCEPGYCIGAIVY